MKNEFLSNDDFIFHTYFSFQLYDCYKPYNSRNFAICPKNRKTKFFIAKLCSNTGICTRTDLVLNQGVFDFEECQPGISTYLKLIWIF